MYGFTQFYANPHQLAQMGITHAGYGGMFGAPKRRKKKASSRRVKKIRRLKKHLAKLQTRFQKAKSAKARRRLQLKIAAVKSKIQLLRRQRKRKSAMKAMKAPGRVGTSTWRPKAIPTILPKPKKPKKFQIPPSVHAIKQQQMAARRIQQMAARRMQPMQTPKSVYEFENPAAASAAFVSADPELESYTMLDSQTAALSEDAFIGDEDLDLDSDLDSDLELEYEDEGMLSGFLGDFDMGSILKWGLFGIAALVAVKMGSKAMKKAKRKKAA